MSTAAPSQLLLTEPCQTAHAFDRGQACPICRSSAVRMKTTELETRTSSQRRLNRRLSRPSLSDLTEPGASIFHKGTHSVTSASVGLFSRTKRPNGQYTFLVAHRLLSTQRGPSKTMYAEAISAVISSPPFSPGDFVFYPHSAECERQCQAESQDYMDGMALIWREDGWALGVTRRCTEPNALNATTLSTLSR